MAILSFGATGQKWTASKIIWPRQQQQQQLQQQQLNCSKRNAGNNEILKKVFPICTLIQQSSYINKYKFPFIFVNEKMFPTILVKILS